MILLMSVGFSMASNIYDELSDRLGLPNNGIRHWEQGPDHGIRTVVLMKILFGNHYFYGIGITINPNVLFSGAETFDCALPLDYRNFGTAFEDELTSIFGGDIFEYLPRYGTRWGCNSVCYCMDVAVTDIDLMLGLLRKTDIPLKNTDAGAISGDYLSCFNSPLLLACDKLKLLAQNKADYKAPITGNIDAAHDTLRLMVQCPKSKLHTIKKQMGFSDLLALDLINPVTAEEVFIRSWDKVIGKGDFYCFAEAKEVIANSGISKAKKNELLDLLELLAECGTIPAARDSTLESGETRSLFNKKLNGLRALGINGALLPDYAGLSKVSTPLGQLGSYFPSINDTLPFSSI